MPSGTAFPAFLRLEHQRDGSAKASFLAEVDSILGNAETRFKEFGAEAGRQLDAALSVKRNGTGSLDLDVTGLRNAAAAQQARAIAARELATATALAAREQGDYSQKTRIAVAALEAQAVEEGRAAQAALSHANAIEQVQAVLNRQKSATDAVTAASGRGTSALGAVTNSTRALRFASLQAGQQVQDVAISLYSGQRASIVLAQQLPQLAFAFSGLEGAAGSTAARVGNFARFLSSGFGSLVAVAGGALAGLAIQLLSSGDEAEEAKGKTFDFSKSLDVLRLSAKDTTDAMSQLEQATRSAISAQGDFLNQQANTANQSVAQIKDRLASEIAELAGLKKNAGAFNLDPTQTYRNISRVSELQGSIESDKKSLDAARTAQQNAEIALTQRRVNDSLDAGTAATNSYNVAIGKLETQRRASQKIERDPLGLVGGKPKGFITQADYEAEYRRLTQIKKAAEEAARASKRSDTTNRQFGREIDIGQARSIASGAGFRVTSGLRSRAEQQRLYDTVRTPQNPVAAPGTSAHERGNALDIAFAPGVTPASIRKAYAEEGVRLTKILKETGHFHIEFSTSGADKAENEAERIAKAAEREADAVKRAQEQINQFAEQSAGAIAQINAEFDDQPRLVDRSAAAVRKLDKITADLNDTLVETVLTQEQRLALEQDFRDAIEARAKAESAVETAIGRQIAQSQQQFQIQVLALSGREKEAAVLDALIRAQDQYGDITAEQKSRIEANTRALYDQNEALQIAREKADAYLESTRTLRGEIEGLLSGETSGKDFLKNIGRSFRQLQGKLLTEKLFGDVFRDLDKAILKNSGIDAAVDKLTKDTERAGDAALNLASDFAEAGRILRGAASGDASLGSVNSAFDAAFGTGGATTGAAANDNAALGAIFDGVVKDIGKADANTVGGMTGERYRELLKDGFSKSVIGQSLDRIVGGASGVFGGGLAGLATGGIPGGVIGALSGIKGLPGAVDKLFGASNVLGKAADGAATGTAVAGFAKALGFKKFSTTGSQIGGAIGSALPIPGGQIIGSIIGGTIGGLLKKAKTGSATLSIGADGVQVGSTGGNSAGRKKAAGDLGGGISDSLNRIAQQLGGTADGPISVSIGIRDKSFRVDTTGKGATKKSKGAIDFGQDQEAAIRFAIADAIKDGVIKGISAAAQRLISTGKDLEQQLQKALDFEGVFTQLRAIKDPVGAALDVLDKEFGRLNRIFGEAGASAEEYAKLEELYGIRRKDAIKQAFESISGSLKSLITDLTIGNDALSLRDRKAFAEAAYNPLAARVAAGDTTAFDEYATAARALLDIERQISGSQGGYQTRLAEVTGLSQATLDKNAVLADAAAGRDSPLIRSAVPITDNQNVVDAVTDLGGKLDAVNANLGNLILLARTGTDGGPGYYAQGFF